MLELHNAPMRVRSYTLLAVVIAVLAVGSRLPALAVAEGEARPPEKVFLGFEADPATSVDLHYYASYVYEARAEAKLLLTDRATTETQEGRVLSLYFSGLGLFARVTGLSIPATWNLWRTLIGLLFFWVLWHLLGVFLPSRGTRLLAFALVAFGGGLGWLMTVLRGALGDHAALYLADVHQDGMIGYSTYGYLYHPQAMLAQTAFLGAALLWAKWRDSGRPGLLFGALGCAALIFTFHAPSAPVFYLALLAAPVIPFLFRWEAGTAWARLRALAPFLLPAALALGYVLWARGDPVYRGFADSYAALGKVHESVFWYPVGYGIVLLLAVVGLPRAVHDAPERRDLLLGWALAALVASVNPLLFAWKFQFALHIPLCILAAEGARWGWGRLTRGPILSRWSERRTVAAVSLVAVASLSSLLIFARTLARASHPLLFASGAQVAALSDLEHRPPGHVLSHYRTGHLVISRTPHRAYLAHYSGTLQVRRKEQEVRAFFGPRTPIERKRAFLKSAHIRYVFFGPHERSLGVVDPALGLRPIFRRGPVVVFEVPG